MDFLKLLKSLEEFLYEAMVLLVFFPRTMWLTLRHPQRMMDYADTELGDVLSGQYDDTVSPPLFLMLTIALSWGVARLLAPDSVVETRSTLLSDPERLLAFRAVAFSLLPLAMSLRLLHELGTKLDRQTLRAPFYSQCFVTAPFALAFGLGLSLLAQPGQAAMISGLVVLVGASAWFVRQQARWFAAKCGSGPGASLATAASTFVLALAALTGTALLVGAAT